MTDNQIDTKSAPEIIERRALNLLTPYANNARTHSAEQVEAIAASVREFGWTNPVLVDENNGIIAGHGRVLAAQKLGMAEVPVIVLRGLTDLQRRVYILADNRIPLNAGWDKKMLSLELGELSSHGFDMTLTGFSEVDLRTFLPDPDPDGEAEEKENEVPALPEVAVTCPGDVWLLGGHRLICGDAADQKVISALMNGQKAALCFTSPPYSSQRDYTTGGIGDWDALMRGVFGAAPMAFDGQILVNLGMIYRKNEIFAYWNTWIDWMAVIAWRRFGWYIWDQGSGMPGDWNGRLAPAFEFVFHFNRDARHPNKIVPCKSAGIPSHARGDKSSMRHKDGKGRGWTHAEKVTQDYKIPDSVIRITRQKGGIGDGIDHPAVFPVGLPEHILLAYSNPGDVCYEPFCGSGTSLIAAEKTKRKLRAVEIAPSYVDVALERYRRLYPDQPITLATTGEIFAAVAARRSAVPATETATL